MDQLDGIDHRDVIRARISDWVSVRNPTEGITLNRRLPAALGLGKRILPQRRW
jgi:hypothetical protein